MTTRPPVPREVLAALRHMQAHMGEPITVTELARVAGVPYRTFTDLFREAMGVTAMTYYRRLRMAGVHADLAAARPGQTTVTDLAIRWGFTHLSWFARDYQRIWGEHPSQTLRRPPAALTPARRIRDRVGIRVARPHHHRSAPPAPRPAAGSVAGSVA